MLFSITTCDARQIKAMPNYYLNVNSDERNWRKYLSCYEWWYIGHYWSILVVFEIYQRNACVKKFKLKKNYIQKCVSLYSYSLSIVNTTPVSSQSHHCNNIAKQRLQCMAVVWHNYVWCDVQAAANFVPRRANWYGV